MKTNRTKQVIAKVLLLTLCISPFASSTVFAQRERVVKTQPKPTPTPKKPVLKIAPTPTPTPTPTPIASPTPAPAEVSKSVEELQTRIREVLNRPGLQRAQVGIKIASLDSGKVLFEENAEKFYMPASNMKAYTIAAALDRLTPDYRFVTSVIAFSAPNKDGVIRGYLQVNGSGDPTFAASLNGGNYWNRINELADKIVAAKVKKVEGDIIGVESSFSGLPIGFGWEADDLQSYYGAPVSALTINDNAIDIFVKPGAKIGDPCFINTGPPMPLMQIVNKTVTVKSGIPRRINITRKLGQNIVEVEGIMPVDNTSGYRGTVSVENPALVFVYMLRTALAERGVTITGQSRTIKSEDDIDNLIERTRKDPAWFERQDIGIGSGIVPITSVTSPPLSEIAIKTMKPSQNLYTELILRRLGENSQQFQEPKDVLLKGQKSSVVKGIEVVKEFLKEAGVPDGSYEIYDGSGLSRHNLITASATVQLYTYMSRHKYSKAFYDSLPIAGVDGTLSNRMKGTAAAGNARAKTGTINQVATLSGYVTTAAGEKLVFSILVNNLPDDSSVRRSYIDEIVVMLASFTGRTDR